MQKYGKFSISFPFLSSETYHLYNLLKSLHGIPLKDPKFSDTKYFCCKLPKIQTKRPKHRIFCPKDANEIANSEDMDQTAPLEAV